MSDNIIQLNQDLIHNELKDLVRNSVEDITEALWGAKVSLGTISNLNKKDYDHVETWRCRALTGEYPYVYVDGVYIKRSWGGKKQKVSILVAIGVNQDGCCEIIDVTEGRKEDGESWKNFFVWLND